jgi:hypothetical protein
LSQLRPRIRPLVWKSALSEMYSEGLCAILFDLMKVM